MDLPVPIPEAAHRCVLRDIKRETCAPHSFETFHDIPRDVVETLRSGVVVCPNHYEVLTRYEPCTVDQWVETRTCVLVPVYGFKGAAQVPKVPYLDAFPFCTASSDDQVSAFADVYGLSTYLGASNSVCDLASSHIPKFNLLVPASRVHHV